MNGLQKARGKSTIRALQCIYKRQVIPPASLFTSQMLLAKFIPVYAYTDGLRPVTIAVAGPFSDISMMNAPKEKPVKKFFRGCSHGRLILPFP